MPATRFSAPVSASASTPEEPLAASSVTRLDRLGDLGDALLGDPQRFADAAGGAARRLLGDAAEALAEPEQLGGERRDLLLRGR